MDGFRFDWTIVEGNDKVKKMTMQEIDSKAQVRTDIFVLRGIALGKATVRVRLLEPGYEHLKEQFIEIMVTEPFVICPQGSVYIMPLCQFKFGLAKLVFEDDGTLQHHDIKIPNKNYDWTSDKKIGTIEANILVVD
jgi:hypothetical protein